MGLQYAKTLELNNNYDACISLLKSIQVLPGEGATEGRTIWRKANLEMAREWIKSEKYRKALANIDQARLWPVNLGVGKPYQVNEQKEDSLALQCYQKLKDEKSIKMIKDKTDH